MVLKRPFYAHCLHVYKPGGKHGSDRRSQTQQPCPNGQTGLQYRELGICQALSNDLSYGNQYTSEVNPFSFTQRELERHRAIRWDVSTPHQAATQPAASLLHVQSN